MAAITIKEGIKMLGFIIATAILFILSVPVMVYLAILDYKIGMKD